MFSRLIRVLLRRPQADGMFHFRVGRRLRSFDPVLVSQLLVEHPEYLPRHLAEARAGDMEAIEVCGRAACDAFGIHSSEDHPRGLTLAERVKLLFAFDLWVIAIKQKHDAFCRMAALHECDVSRLDRERFCALYFSRQETEIRRAETIRTGNAATGSELPLAWFIATRDTIDEAKLAYDCHVAAVATARR